MSLKLELFGDKSTGYGWKFMRGSRVLAQAPRRYTRHSRAQSTLVRFIREVQWDDFNCFDTSDVQRKKRASA